MLHYIAIIAIALINYAVVFFSMVFMVSGVGSNDDVLLWYRIGVSVIVACTVAALIITTFNRQGYAEVLALLPVPALFFWLSFTQKAEREHELARADSPAMAAACKQVGTHYLATPSAPVRSVAYDWPPHSHPTPHSYFRFDERGHVRGSGGSNTLPRQIEFIETRCCRLDRKSPSTVGDYRRRVNDGSTQSEDIAQLSADVLIHLDSITAPATGDYFAVRKTEITVTDRRDGRLLATLSYAHDIKMKRICGSTSPGTVDEKAFVLRAIGAAPSQ